MIVHAALRGLGASPGVAVGRALGVRDPTATAGPPDVEAALAALAQAAAELGAAADDLRRAGLVDEAEILETSCMMAEDPVLAAEVRGLAARLAPAAALRASTEDHARTLAALTDPLLAARAADVRELGRRAARIAEGQPPPAVLDGDTILLARELGPAEVAELELGAGRIVGLALADGSATSHAAIIARSLGVPMAVALGPDLIEVADGALLIVDGDEGLCTVEPAPAELEEALEAMQVGDRRRRALAGLRGLPVQTADGRRVELLCNAASVAEVEAGLAAGASGVGLLRTELSFLEAAEWPDEPAHHAALAPALELLAGRIATVRTLDFGADKTPPFLTGVTERGLELTLAHPDALIAQLRAIVRAGSAAKLRLLLPLVETGEQLRHMRSLLAEGVAAHRPLELGAMIETPTAVRRAAEIAAEADFISIGTNDLVAATLGLRRDLPLASAATAAEPAVLEHVATVVAAAHGAGIGVEICGEAAGIPELVVLFVGVGVDELSVAPARVDLVRAVVRAVSAERAAAVVHAALQAASADDVLALVRSGETGDELRQALEGLDGVRA